MPAPKKNDDRQAGHPPRRQSSRALPVTTPDETGPSWRVLFLPERGNSSLVVATQQKLYSNRYAGSNSRFGEMKEWAWSMNVMRRQRKLTMGGSSRSTEPS